MNTRLIGWRGPAIAALFAFGIATTIATGGGGGDGWGNGTSDDPTIAINATNAPDVSSALVVAIGVTFDLGDLTREGIPIQAGGIQFTMSGTTSDDSFIGSGAVAQAPGLDECTNGGTVDITYTLANPNAYSVGDNIVAVFDSCDYGFGYVISGTIDLTVSAIQGDILSEVFLLGMDVLMSDVMIDDESGTATMDGSFTMTFDNLDFPVIGLNIAGDYLDFAADGQTLSLTNFDHDLKVDFGLEPETILARVSGRLESTELGGSIDYETPVDVRAVDDLDPHSGEILITGADESSVRIVIVDSSNVTLEVDANGDGTVDEYIYTNWSELNGHMSTINASTAPVVAREVYNAVTGFGSLVTAAGTQFIATAPFAKVDQLGFTGDFPAVDIACAISGIASVSGSKASADGFTAGDHLVADFVACARGFEVLEGDMEFTVAGYSRGESGEFFVAGTAVDTDLVRTLGGNCYVGSGSFETSYDYHLTSAGIIHVEGSTNTFDVGAGGRFQHLAEAGNSGDILVTQQPVAVARNSWGRISSDDLTGSFDYETSIPVVFNIDTDVSTGPYEGELLVTASDGSTMRMVALDAYSVRLDLDLNGDLIVDESLTTTWAELSYDGWWCP